MLLTLSISGIRLVWLNGPNLVDLVVPVRRPVMAPLVPEILAPLRSRWSGIIISDICCWGVNDSDLCRIRLGISVCDPDGFCQCFRPIPSQLLSEHGARSASTGEPAYSLGILYPFT